MDKPKIRTVRKVSGGQASFPVAVHPRRGNALPESSRVRIWCAERNDFGQPMCAAKSDLEYAVQAPQWMLIHRRIEPDHTEFRIKYR